MPKLFILVKSTLNCLFMASAIFLIGLSVAHAQQKAQQATALLPTKITTTQSVATTAPSSRVALVIGNAAYLGPAALKNSVNDAIDISAKLKKLGFDVTLRTDITLKQMLRALTEFGDKVQDGAEILFYYAGHGMQVRGRNYLIPVDAEIHTESSVGSEAVDVDQLLEKLSPARLSLVILDACRNNPFERRFRGGGQGLAQISAPTGSLIAYATAPGKTAADGDGRNGLYTSELLKAMDVPGSKVEDVFKRVRSNVVKRSGEAQTPWESSSLTGDFYFTFQGPATIQVQPLPLDGESETWKAAENANSLPSYKAYIDAFPEGKYAVAAKIKIGALTKPAANDIQLQSFNASTRVQNASGLMAERYIDNRDGTVTDLISKLQWTRCSIGQTWNGETCEGDALVHSWENSKKPLPSIAGFSDWRLPTIDELKTLVYCSSDQPSFLTNGKGECSRNSKAPTIDNTAFPNTHKSFYWTQSSYTMFSSDIWLVSFDNGSSDGYSTSSDGKIRLVRRSN